MTKTAEKKPLMIDFDAVARLKQRRAARTRPAVDDEWDRFEFSKCYTDFKPGEESERYSDYILGSPWRAAYQQMRDLLGLPDPTAIHRGSSEELVFTVSHGAVLRIGPAHPARTLNPGILQPIGWLQNDRLDFSVLIVGGIEIAPKMPLEALCTTIENGDNYSIDVKDTNVGILRENGQAHPVLLDFNRDFNGARSTMKRLGEVSEVGLAVQMAGLQVSDVMSASMQALFKDRAPREYLDAQRQHDGLRYLFSRAFSSPHVEQCTVDPHWRAAFWSAMRRATLGPLTLPAPRWRVEEKEDRRLLTVREETVTTQLYTPWTKRREP